jgi:hypothetical protein
MFFVLSYAFAWTGFALMYFTGASSSQPLFYAALPLVTFAPAGAAVIVNRACFGSGAIEKTFAPVARWRLSAGWYLFIFSWYPLVRWLAFYLDSRLHGEPMHVQRVNPILIVLGGVFSAVVGGPLGEEIGWRGFALPHLDEMMNPFASALALGALWACWHLPSFYVPGTDEYGKPFASFAMNVVALSLVLSAIWRSTHSVFLCIVQHAVVNASTVIGSNTQEGGWHVWDAIPAARYVYLMLFIVAIALIVPVAVCREPARAAS